MNLFYKVTKERGSKSKHYHSKKNFKSKSYSELDIPSDDKWNTSGLKKINKVVTCNSCHSLNDGETNYCGTCGNYLS